MINKFIRLIFSVKNEGFDKIVRILGIKFKFKNSKLIKKFVARTYVNHNSEVFDYLKRYTNAINNHLPLECSNKYNNPIWILWLQGEENFPELVKICVNSVKYHNPNRKVIILTAENIKDYIQFPDYIIQKYKNKIISNTHFSDLIRLFLLYQYGGTWIDSSVFMTGKIPDYIENSPFFVFKTVNGLLFNESTTVDDYKLLSNYINKPEHLSSNWFIYSIAGSNILKNTIKMLLEYWKNEDSLLDYFIFHYLFCLAILNDNQARKEYLGMPSFSNVNPHLLQYNMWNDYSKDVFENITKLSPIHKLTWKYMPWEKSYNPNSLLNYVLNNF